MIKRPLLAALLCAGWVMLSPARAATPHQDALYHAIGPFSWVYPLADYIDAAIASAGAGCTMANPTATASDVAVNGVLTTCMRSDAAPAVQKASSSQFGLVKVDNQTIVAAAGVISAASATRTAASPTVVTGDMGGTLIISSGGITFPVISAGLFDNKQTLRAANAAGSASAVTNSTGQTINAGGGCVVASGIPTNGYWDVQPNGSSIDCQQAISAAPPTPASAGTNVTLTGPRAYYWCSGTCTVTLPVPVAGYEFCIRNADNVATVITLAALTTSARYEQTARTGYGTAGTGTAIAGGVVTDQICLLGKDATHYDVMSSVGTWTLN